MSEFDCGAAAGVRRLGLAGRLAYVADSFATSLAMRFNAGLSAGLGLARRRLSGEWFEWFRASVASFVRVAESRPLGRGVSAGFKLAGRFTFGLSGWINKAASGYMAARRRNKNAAACVKRLSVGLSAGVGLAWRRLFGTDVVGGQSWRLASDYRHSRKLFNWLASGVIVGVSSVADVAESRPLGCGVSADFKLAGFARVAGGRPAGVGLDCRPVRNVLAIIESAGWRDCGVAHWRLSGCL